MPARKLLQKVLSMAGLVSCFVSTIGVPLIAKAQTQYNRQEAVLYAQSYAHSYCTDGWFFRNCSGEPVRVNGGSTMTEEDKAGGCDCSHYVSCAIGNESNDEGGGLDVDHPYSPYVYGYPGVVALGDYLLGCPGEEVDTIGELQPGDVIQFHIINTPPGLNHSVVYVGNNKICAHSRSRLNEPYTNVQYDQIRRIHIISTTTGIPTLSEWKRIFLTLFIVASGIAFMRYRQYAPAQFVEGLDKSKPIRGAAIFEGASFRQISIWCSISAIIGMILILILYGKVTSLDILGIIICSPLLAYILNAAYIWNFGKPKTELSINNPVLLFPSIFLQTVVRF